jgi:hypothetical protein
MATDPETGKPEAVPTPAVESREESDLPSEGNRTSVLVVIFIALVLILLLIGVGAVVYFQNRPAADSSEGASVAIPSVTTKWIDGSTAAQRFEAEWKKARVLSLAELDEFVSRYWSLEAEYIKDPYSASPAEVERKKTELFRDFVKGGLLAIEFPFAEFFAGEVSKNTDRYTVKLIGDDRAVGDGGAVRLRGLLSLKMPVVVTEAAMQAGGSVASQKVRLILSVYHVEPRSESRSVRPMELPQSVRRFNAINNFVTFTEADIVLSADLIGIASFEGNGRLAAAKMKGFVIPGE